MPYIRVSFIIEKTTRAVKVSCPIFAFSTIPPLGEPHGYFWMSNHAAQNSPREFFFLFEELSGIFAFMDLWSQTRFLCLWVPMRKRAGIVKGLLVPLLLGFQ